MSEIEAISGVVLNTPEPDRFVDCGESRPLPMFHIATLMQYGERCAETAIAWLRSQGEPMFWVRLTSDGGYEGPIHNDGIERVRRQSGAWHPLFIATQPAIHDGWQLVPKEPTQAMHDAGRVALAPGNVPLAKVYRAMLQAAPEPSK